MHDLTDTQQVRFIHDVLRLAQDGDFLDELRWHSDGQQITIAVEASGIFAWGDADREGITPERLSILAQAVVDLRAIHTGDAWDFIGIHAVELYTCRIRGMRPRRSTYSEEYSAAEQALFDACGPERATGLGI